MLSVEELGDGSIATVGNHTRRTRTFDLARPAIQNLESASRPILALQLVSKSKTDGNNMPRQAKKFCI